MSGLLRPRNLAFIGVLAGTGTLLLARKDQGTKNVEDRFSAAGGATGHAPAGGTRMGDSDQVAAIRRVGKGGIDSKEFQDNLKEQRGEPDVVAKAWNRRQHGTDTGK